MTLVALYPWETVDMAVREQAESEVWADTEHDAWLAEVMAIDVESMSELEFMEYTLQQHQPATVLPWSRVDEIELEIIGLDFSTRPYLY